MRLLRSYNKIKSPTRHVRTRLYFTSESHVHSLLNSLRHWTDCLDPEASDILGSITELDYLTHIVFRVYERPRVRGDV